MSLLAYPCFCMHACLRLAACLPLRAGYMCATGLMSNDPEHAAQMLRFAQEMQRQAAHVQMPDGSGPVRIRIGEATHASGAREQGDAWLRLLTVCNRLAAEGGEENFCPAPSWFCFV